MSKINVEGVVKNIKTRTNVYMPIVESIINSIDAIEEKEINNGKIELIFKRDRQQNLNIDDIKPDFISLEVIDNGIGFTSKHRNSFDTIYSNIKSNQGGKGFGRFMYIKYFDNVKIESIFNEDGKCQKRSFSFGKEDEIIVKEEVENIDDKIDTKTILYLEDLKDRKLDKNLETIAKRILERILVYFITENYSPPEIILKDENNNIIVLNELILKIIDIKKEKEQTFELKENKDSETFKVLIFKIYAPGHQKSKIIFTADKREVISTNLYDYIPEFEEEFYDQISGGANKNYIIKVYILGAYLDKHVTLERDNFNFCIEKDLFYPFGREDIERKTVEILEQEYSQDLKSRIERKKERVKEYIKENPWYKEYYDHLDWNSLQMSPDEYMIEKLFHKCKYEVEKTTKQKIKKILLNDNVENFEQKATLLLEEIDRAKMSDLAHYVTLRKVVLDMMKKALEINNKKKYSYESVLHNMIFPIKYDSDFISFENHNLWILDERLAFSEYLASDIPLNGKNSNRPDILCFERKIAFRGDNEPTNPIIIFEFKRPGLDTFANKSSKEDPYDQIIRYVEDIKNRKFTTPKGRQIQTGNQTPFYGFIIADLTIKVRDWLKRKNFKSLPDAQRHYYWHDGYNLYTEFISWTKLIKDAEMRNKIFFNKLGI